MYLAEYFGKHEGDEHMGTFHREEALKTMPLVDVKDWLYRARTLLFMGRQKECCASVRAAYEESQSGGWWLPGAAPPKHQAMLLNNLLICEALDHFESGAGGDIQNQAAHRVSLVEGVLAQLQDEQLRQLLSQHLTRLDGLSKGTGVSPFEAVFVW